jgi:hypothetical protein
MLLDEFLKEHRTVQDLKATVAKQERQIEALTAGLQKVSAQLELSNSVPQTVLTIGKTAGGEALGDHR